MRGKDQMLPVLLFLFAWPVTFAFQSTYNCGNVTELRSKLTKEIAAQKGSHPSELIEMFNRDFGPYFALLGNCFIELDNLLIHVFTTNLSQKGKRVRFPDGSEVEFPIQNIPKNISCLVALWSNGFSQFGDNSDTLCEFGKCHSLQNSSVLTITCYDGLRILEEKISTIFILDVRNDLSILELVNLPRQRVTKLSHKCVRWKTELDLWSGENCSVSGASGGVLVGCECSSAANATFSFMYSAKVSTISISAFYIQVILGGISISTLFFTLMFLIVARVSKVQCQVPPPLNRSDIRRHRFAMQFNLVLSMFGLHSAFISTIAANELGSRTLCFAITALFHFFLLATAFWFLNQSISLFLKISDNFAMQLDYKKLTAVQLVIGWGAPLIIVAATIGVLKDVYIDDDVVHNLIQTKTNYGNFTENYQPSYVCSVNQTNQVAVISTTVVIAVVIVADAAVTIRALFIIKRLIRQQISTSSSNLPRHSCKAKLHKLEYLRSLGKSLLILLPVSTFPWLIDMFAFLKSEDAVLKIHVYTCWTQGVGIFVLFCVVNRIDREKIVTKWKRSSIRNRFRKVLNRSQ